MNPAEYSTVHELTGISRTYPDKSGQSTRKGFVITERKMLKNDRMTITDIAGRIGVTPKTIVRWEKASKIGPAKRDWRGWRVYNTDDLKKLKAFKEMIRYVEEV